MPDFSPPRVPTRALALTAACGACWVFVLVTLGAFTTSIGAGMAFPDWPLSDGSLNPAGWLSDLARFAEHSHRLSAAVMTATAVVLCFWVLRAEPRPWLRRLAVWAVALVLLQALVGGLRVLLEHHQVAMIGTSVGRLFAMLHACLAQVFVCALLALAVGLSRGWSRSGGGGAYTAAAQRWGLICCGLLFLQLGVGAVMRHSGAGLAIPTFPWSNPEGGLLPATWDFRVAIHFTHRALALVLAFALPCFLTKLRADPAAGRGARRLGAAVVALLSLQIGLGVASVLTLRNPQVTTAHVLVGALLLATTFVLTLLTRSSRLEPPVTAATVAATANRGSFAPTSA